MYIIVYDECTEGTHTCHMNEKCTNTETLEGFTCSCKDGYFSLEDGALCQGETENWQTLICT